MYIIKLISFIFQNKLARYEREQNEKINTQTKNDINVGKKQEKKKTIMKLKTQRKSL